MSEGSTRMTEGMLSLSWNNHSAAFSQMLATFREREIFADVTLACGGNFYRVHRFVLSTCSDYFLQIFERTSCSHPIVILKDVQCREMEALLSYMYAGIVCIPQSDLAQLIRVAEELQIKGLAVPDETMCTNKKMSYTWSPTDDRISPHAKRLRPDDNSSGVQYQRFSDGHTIVKPQTLTGIPSFAAGVPVSRGYSPTAASVVKHVQPSIRPGYTSTRPSQRYSPYSKDTDRQQSSPNMIHKMDIKDTEGILRTDQKQDAVSGNNGKQTDMKFGNSPSLQSNGPKASASKLSQNTSSEMEIIPEAAVKVELEEGNEPLNIDSSGMIHIQPSEENSGRRISLSKMDAKDMSKSDIVLKQEGETLDEKVIKKEVESADEKKANTKKYDGLVSTSTSTAVRNNKETQTVKDNQPSALSFHQEGASENPHFKTTTADASTNWEGDEDSSHPLDLSDTHKHHTQHGKDQLLKHIGTHTLMNPFHCPYCPYRAPLSKSMREHISTHQGGSEGGH